MRDSIISAIIYIAFLFLAAALFFTQIVRFGTYSELSRNNSIRIVPIDAPRGIISDRNGVVLVSSRLVFDVAVIYQELRNKTRLKSLLESVAGVDREVINRKLEIARLKPYAPVTIVEDLNKTSAIEMEEASADIDGLVIETRSLRDYRYGEIGAHIFGYLGEISEEELENLKDYGYRSRDLVGRAGIEKQYNAILSGDSGGTQIEVDSRGRQSRVLGIKEPLNGKDITLTIDIRLQRLCDELLGDWHGAIIVMSPKTGEVFALSSRPGFNPSVFIRSNAQRERFRLITDRRGRPLFNRAISGLYPSGSIFKVVIATAGLLTHKISSGTTFQCDGAYHLGGTAFGCWKSDGHGPQDLTDALMNSCNVFFYNTGHLAGVDAIEACARRFGFGRTTGIDMPDEASGVVPGRSWKRIIRGEEWFEGDTANYSIGQGYLLVSPLQTAVMISAVANDGYIIQPYLAKTIDGTVVPHSSPRSTGVPKEVIKKIKEGLRMAVNGDSGTAKRAKLSDVVVAAKTGTAQNPHGKTHGWFAGFAPFDDPRLSCVVLVEHGGHGGGEPADMAREIFSKAKELGYI